MRFAVVALVALALAGCGSAAGSSLEDAAEATGAETSRVDIAYRIAATKDEKEYVFRSTGLLDYPGERAAFTTSDSVPFYGEAVDLKEIRMIGQTAYWRWAVKGKTYWMKQDPARKSGDPVELLIPGPGTPTKPTDVLNRVLRASEGNLELGKEDVRGETTTRYRARVNLKELVKQVPANDRPPDELRRQFGGPVPVDLWIDGESRLRKIVITRPVMNGSDDPDAPVVTMTVELYDYGVEVDVQPPEGELISEEELDQLTDGFGLVTEEGGEAEACEPQGQCENKKP